MPPGRLVVLVSGAPGAGKSTLAGPLAAELGFMLLAKDRIKETLYDELGAAAPVLAETGPKTQSTAETNGPGDYRRPASLGPSREWSRRLGAASMELLWALAADAPAVVLEANFRPRSDYQRDKIRAIGGRLVEVHCACPAAVAARRFADRAVHSRHAVHVNPTLSPDELAEFDRPVGIGELITVDTTVLVDVPALAAGVRARLALPA